MAQMVKRLRQCRRPGFDPWVGKIPWRRKWQSTPGLLPGKSHGQRSLVVYSPWGRKELDTTERLHFTSCLKEGFPDGASGKEPACQRRRNRDTGLIRKIPWRRGWKPNTVFFLENSTNRRAWQSTVHGVAKSRTRLSDFTISLYAYADARINLCSAKDSGNLSGIFS